MESSNHQDLRGVFWCGEMPSATVIRIQDTVNLVDDAIVGENASAKCLGIAEEDTGSANRYCDSTTLESADSRRIQLEYTAQDVVKKGLSQSSLPSALVRKSKIASESLANALLIGATKVSSPGPARVCCVGDCIGVCGTYIVRVELYAVVAEIRIIDHFKRGIAPTLLDGRILVRLLYRVTEQIAAPTSSVGQRKSSKGS
jgi:hypothetical protein